MGNCFKKQLVIEDSLRLIDHNYDIVHDIETLKEDMNKTNNNISSLNTSTNNNFELVSQDIFKLKKTILEIQKFNEEMFYYQKTIHFKNQNNENNENNDIESPNLIDYDDDSLSLSNHQPESRYGGFTPDTIQEDLEGPLLTNDSTSSNVNALL